jgi:hypothetical protein
MAKYLSLIGLYTFLMILGICINWSYGSELLETSTYSIISFFVIWAAETAGKSK